RARSSSTFSVSSCTRQAMSSQCRIVGLLSQLPLSSTKGCRFSTYVFGDWNKCGELMGLAPYGRREQVGHLLEMKDGTLHVPF
ncbi:hypothetical protein FNJ47_47695, partial [Bradyrhizobium sp. UFLA 03-164]|nr:hypothetical protein [Bradyrhizobium uaiense]